MEAKIECDKYKTMKIILWETYFEITNREIERKVFMYQLKLQSRRGLSLQFKEREAVVGCSAVFLTKTSAPHLKQYLPSLMAFTQANVCNKMGKKVIVCC